MNACTAPGFDRMLEIPGWAIDRRAELHTTIVLFWFYIFLFLFYFDVSIDFSVIFANPIYNDFWW